MKQVLTSVWGAVRRCYIIAPDVYQVEAVLQPDGYPIPLHGGGIMIPAEAAARLLPQKALAFGECSEQQLQITGDTGEHVECQAFLHYDRDTTQLIALYELLSRRIITDYDIIRDYHEHDLINQGRFHLPDYFGELLLPLRIYLRADSVRRLDNGIWAVCKNGAYGLVVHKTVADYCMSPLSAEFATRLGNSLVFKGNWVVVALYELYPTSRLLREKCDDPEGIVEALKTQCGLYVALSGVDPDSLYEELRGA